MTPVNLKNKKPQVWLECGRGEAGNEVKETGKARPQRALYILYTTGLGASLVSLCL